MWAQKAYDIYFCSVTPYSVRENSQSELQLRNAECACTSKENALTVLTSFGFCKK